jgi:hypothetical protein
LGVDERGEERGAFVQFEPGRGVDEVGEAHAVAVGEAVGGDGYPCSSERPAKGEVTSDDTANQRAAASEPTTIAEVLRVGQPMGDLRRFVIEDLTPEEEDESFRILEEA